MDRAQRRTRGGDADGARQPPKSATRTTKKSTFSDELDDTFPASDPPAAPSPSARSLLRQSRADPIDVRPPRAHLLEMEARMGRKKDKPLPGDLTEEELKRRARRRPRRDLPRLRSACCDPAGAQAATRSPITWRCRTASRRLANWSPRRRAARCTAIAADAFIATIGHLGARRWASRQWICCVLQFKERRHPVWRDRYTALFFLDEVTALAAGHRPCFECRRRDAKAFAEKWAQAKGGDDSARARNGCRSPEGETRRPRQAHARNAGR